MLYSCRNTMKCWSACRTQMSQMSCPFVFPSCLILTYKAVSSLHYQNLSCFLMIPPIQSGQVEWSLGLALRDILHLAKPSNSPDAQIQAIPQNTPLDRYFSISPFRGSKRLRAQPNPSHLPRTSHLHCSASAIRQSFTSRKTIQ